MSALTDALARPIGRCGFATAIHDCDDEDRAAIWEHVKETAWTPSELASVLLEHGLDVTAKQVARHRRGECVSCQG